MGQSISGGAATIAATTATDVIAGAVELAPFTRKQSLDLIGTLRHKHVRAGMARLMRVVMSGSLQAWLRYLDIAVPAEPDDRSQERVRIEATLSHPERMAALRAMAKTSPADAGAQLPKVCCPVLIVEGSADPDRADPRAEGVKIIGDLPYGLGQVPVIDGAGHDPHTEAPAEVLALLLPFLDRTLSGSAGDPGV